MSAVISKEYVTNILNKIATTLRLNDWSYEEENLKPIAQNYFGVLVPIILRGQINEEHKVLRIMLKLAPPDDRYRVSGAVTEMFAREIFLYSEVFQMFHKLQMQLKLEFQYIIPECYYVCKDYCNEVIAMKNICENGYQPYVHTMFLEIDHVTISLKSLAKFHALSLIMERQQSDLFDEVKKVCVPLSEKTNKRYMEVLIDRLEKALIKFENSEYVALLKHLKTNCAKYIEATYLSTDKICLCHGDIWKENIMFKYEDNKPISACLIDYQTSRICSPAFDVLYLITSSTDSKLRKEFFNTLLDVYYSTLIKIICDVKIDPSDIYNRGQFDSDIKIVAPACLIVANTALWLSNGLQQEGHVRSKQVLRTESEKARAVDKYKSIIKDIIVDFYSFEYLPVILSESNNNFINESL